MSFFLILVLVAVVVLPQTEMGKTFLLERAKHLIGQDIQVEKFDLALLPSPRLQLIDFEIKNINPYLEYLKAQFLEVEILLLPLFLRTVVVKRFILEQPEITIQLLQKKQKPMFIPSPEEKETVPSVPHFAFEQVAIHQGKLTLRKKSKFKGTKDLYIEDIFLTLSAPSPFSQATVEGSAKIPNPTNDASLLLVSGNIDQPPSYNIIPFRLGKTQVTRRFTGHAELSNFDLAIIDEFFELGTQVTELPAFAQLKSSLALFPDHEGMTLVYSELEGTVGTIPIRGNGSFSGIFGDDTTFFTSFSSSPISLQALDPFIPEALLPPDFRKTLEELEIDGKVEIINSFVAGSTADDQPISIVEKLRLSQGRVLINPKTPSLTNIEGIAVWDNGELQLTNVSGRYGSSTLVEGQGEIQFDESGPWANLLVTSQVDVRELVTTWKAFAAHSEIPATLEGLQGAGKLTMNVQGPLHKPENLAFSPVKLQDWNLTLSHDLPPIHHVSGVLDIVRDRLTWRGFTAQQGSSKILKTEGSVQFRETGPWLDVKADTVINIQDLKSLTAHLVPALDMRQTIGSLIGEGHLTLDLKGPLYDLQKLEIEEVRLQEGRLRIHPDLDFIEPMEGRMSYKNGMLHLTNLSFAFRASRIRNTSITVNLRETELPMKMDIQSEVMAKDLLDLIKHLDTIPETLQAVNELEEVAGEARLTGTLQGPLYHPKQLRVVAGEIDLRDIGFRTLQVSKPVDQINGRILLSKDFISISNFSGRIGGSRASLDGMINWKEGKIFQDLIFQNTVEVADIKNIWPGILPETLQGTLQSNGVLFGPQDSTRYRIHTDLKGIDLNIPNVIHKPSGMPAFLKMRGEIKEQEIFLLDNAELASPNITLLGKGTFDTREPFMIKASVKTGPVSLALLPDEFLFGIKKFQAGDLSLAFDVEGKGTNWRGWKINGSTRLDNVVTEDEAPDDPMTNISVDVRLTEEDDEIQFSMEAVPIKNILPFLGIAKYPIEGEAYANGLFQCRIEPDQDLLPTLQGNAKLLIKDGIVHGGHAIPKILSLMNLPSLISGEVKLDQENIPFDSISLDLNMRTGVIHTENYILKSPIVVLSAVGNYDLPADRMDFVVAASPLSAHKKYIEYIPLVNRFFGEELLTLFFKVKGPFNDPQVWPISFGAVGIAPQKWLDQSVNALKGAVSKEEEADPTRQKN